MLGEAGCSWKCLLCWAEGALWAEVKVQKPRVSTAESVCKVKEQNGSTEKPSC